VGAGDVTRTAEVTEQHLGPGLPTLRIGSAPQPLVYLPGLSLHPGIPSGTERRMAVAGWEPLLDDYSVYWVGRRVRPPGTTFTHMAEDVAAAIEELGPPVDLIGASTGGMLAIHVAAERPDLIRRLVLVVTGSSASAYGRRMGTRVTNGARDGRWRDVFAAIFPIGGRSRGARVARAALGWLAGPRLLGVPADPTLMLAELQAWDTVDGGPLLDRIRCPTLVIGGADDPIFPPSGTRAMAGRLHDAVVVIEPKLAHDFPARLIADPIAPFLKAAGPARSRS